MGTWKLYGLTLVVVGITNFPFIAPTLGSYKIYIGTIGCEV